MDFTFRSLVLVVGYSGFCPGDFDWPVDELRVDLEALVLRFINPPTRVASLFKGIYSASPTRKQQSPARDRPGSRRTRYLPAGNFPTSAAREKISTVVGRVDRWSVA